MVEVKGGADTVETIQILCKTCNLRKEARKSTI